MPSEKPAEIAERPSLIRRADKALKNLSARERALLWALAIVVVILALLLLLILPGNDRLMAAKSQQQQLRSDQIAAQMAIAEIPVSQELLLDSEARYGEYLERYQAVLLPEEIDRMLTSLIQDCGFTASSLTLAPSTTEGVPRFAATALSQGQPSVATTGGSGGEDATGTSAPAATDSTGVPNATTGGDGTSVAVTGAADDGSSDNGASDAGSAPSSSRSDGGSTAAAADTPEGASAIDPQVQVYHVQATVIGSDESFLALLDKTLPLSWLKIDSSTYTPSPSAYASGSSAQLSSTFNFKIYVHAEASAKSI